MAAKSSKDDLARCDRELAELMDLWASGHPDRRGIVRAMEDWIMETILIEEEMRMGTLKVEETGKCPECWMPVGEGGHLSTCSIVHPVDKSARGHLTDGHHRICAKALSIMRAKNHDYASDEDPFRNFRAFGRFGILVRLSDKLARLQSFLENGKLKVADESIEDTICDIINYAILFQQYEEK